MKKVLSIVLCAFLALFIVGCGGGSSEPAQEEKRYQSILDEYTQKLQEAAPRLAEEYNAEYPNCGGDINQMAKLSNDKVGELAEINNDGISEMADIMTKNGDDYETYEEWAGKLMDVYMECAGQITDAYMNSAMQPYEKSKCRMLGIYSTAGRCDRLDR